MNWLCVLGLWVTVGRNCWTLLFLGVGLHRFLLTLVRMDFRNDLSLLSFEDLWCCVTIMMWWWILTIEGVRGHLYNESWWPEVSRRVSPTQAMTGSDELITTGRWLVTCDNGGESRGRGDTSDTGVTTHHTCHDVITATEGHLNIYTELQFNSDNWKFLKLWGQGCLREMRHSLKPHQAGCQMKALVLYFPEMSLDMRFGLKLSDICKKTWQ